MTYFLCDRPLAPGNRVALAGEEARHAAASRRLRPGEVLALQDPEGRRFSATVESRERDALWLRIGDPMAAPGLPALGLTLLQAVVKAKAAEWIVQKATELGVARVVWFPSERCTVAERELNAPRTRERWERIAWEACKQSDRQSPPQIELAPGLGAALEPSATAADGAEPAEIGWVLHEPGGGDAAAALEAAPAGVTAARVLVGPEGGLSDAEVDAAEAAGLLRVRLGGLVLRAETAAAAACALLLHGR